LEKNLEVNRHGLMEVLSEHSRGSTEGKDWDPLPGQVMTRHSPTTSFVRYRYRSLMGNWRCYISYCVYEELNETLTDESDELGGLWSRNIIMVWIKYMYLLINAFI
jgi:hypothetical protein